MNLNTSIDRSLCVRTDIDLKNDNKIIEGKKKNTLCLQLSLSFENDFFSNEKKETEKRKE